eukprot:TRINITY_DN1794_c0_g1_i1.p1 TRINITY_DN1794_c0_g1~~TRINITY_DN1794_c0_g1_i1.p1  ORF type:complete len:672 (-),score=198.86 TRINITY_DN1794_c0_g1_i1:1220-3235(-)
MALEQLLPTINRLQDVFTTLGVEPIDLPQIVVVGSQSSGKSSVLENIVGKDFLPRGSGIVTRRPLILQLIQNKVDGKEWGEFLHRAGQKFTNFSEMREEIRRETDKTAGTNKGVHNSPINLKIYSPNVLNLTLVDLPGMTRVPVGDQPLNIETLVRGMILQFIQKPNAIILAVSAANSDISNSDALQLAREVDPEGRRTLGVITKVDIMDRGTSAIDVLLNQTIPLRLGYVGVINRSQADIDASRPISEALKAEAAFFRGQPLYAPIADRCGTPYLAQKLSQVLMDHIRDVLPALKQKIAQKLAEVDAELRTYGDPILQGSQGALLLKVITAFSEDFKNVIDGKNPEVNKQEITGGARISYIFTDVFSPTLMGINPLDDLTADDIRTALRNATGPRIGLFIPESSFEQLARTQISKLEDPAMHCLEMVYQELSKIVSYVETRQPDLQRFIFLREKLLEAVADVLRGLRTPTRQMIQNLLSIHLAYINTSHPDFIGRGGVTRVIEEQRAAQAQAQQAQQGGSGAPARSVQAVPGRSAQAAPAQHVPASFGDDYGFGDEDAGLKPVPTSLRITYAITEKEQSDAELMRTLLQSYFDTVRKNVNDAVPKTIMYFMVNSAKESLHNELINRLFKPDLFDELLEESHGIAEKRKGCQLLIDALRKAHRIVNEVRGL